MAIAAGADIAPSTALPDRWKDYVQAIAGVTPPEVMTDGHDGMFTSWAEGFDPESDLDRTVMSTRKNIFPFYGLDAYYD